MGNDWRDVENGRIIPTENYSDQPYVVRTDDGAWLCCVTTGSGNEGEAGQHVLTQRSTDAGRSWTDAVKVEPECPYENSYAVLLKAPSGRVFVFYDHNTDNLREVPSADGRPPVKRVDSLGHFVFRYSDDHGRSWSRRRFDIPLRRFRCDRENVYGGRVCFFWNVGRAFAHDGGVYVTLNKLGDARFKHSEGALLYSPDLLTVDDPAQASWETLPDGDEGLRTPPDGGSIAEEHNITILSDGSFYDTCRTMDGLTVEAVSRDRGHTWSAPRWMRRANGRLMKNPRAANFVWRCANGKYLYWFHNHGGRRFIDAQ
ncbi:MAG: exo-alpha-sialidase, partial [Lentisphaeria bacterium]|nr:exo-alpha-sialidase [Lentisphaeria bacterium]